MKSRSFLIVAVVGLLVSAGIGMALIVMNPSYTGAATVLDESHTRKHCTVKVATTEGEEITLRLGKGRVCRGIEKGQTIELNDGYLAK